MIFFASSSVLPITISVSAEELAIALAQPKVWNFASAMRPSGPSRNWKRSASPQASDPTVAVPSGFSMDPTFRGFRKWSMTFSE